MGEGPEIPATHRIWEMRLDCQTQRVAEKRAVWIRVFSKLKLGTPKGVPPFTWAQKGTGATGGYGEGCACPSSSVAAGLHAQIPQKQRRQAELSVSPASTAQGAGAGAGWGQGTAGMCWIRQDKSLIGWSWPHEHREVQACPLRCTFLYSASHPCIHHPGTGARKATS